MLDVRRMRVLREVALRGSFSAAAESLAFTQSAVSQQIAALEREAGTRLVQRNARGVRLTQAGEALVRQTDAILLRLAEAEAELEAIAGLRGGRLRMAAFESAGASLMPLAIARFREHHPGVELSMTLSEPEDSLPLVAAGELDLALVVEARIREGVEDGIARVHLLSDPMYLVLPAGHPLARKKKPRLADLATEAWIGGPPNCECSRLIYRACGNAGYDPRIAFETDDYTAVQGFVAAGVGVSLIAELGLTTLRDDIVVRSLGREAPVREIHVATAAELRSPAAAAMVDTLVSVAADHAARRRPALALAGPDAAARAARPA
jgi:DNA-binding transcriptional LysR family regulator